MFKHLLRVTTTLGMLLAGYAGYVHVFALVAASLRPAGGGEGVKLHKMVESSSLKEANALALMTFGPEHWTVAEKQIYRMYNADRGFWMYFRDYERLKDGKRIRFTPFAMISGSADDRAKGKGLKIATSHSALVDLDQPFDAMMRPGAQGNVKILHARLEGEVVLRDDKGTNDPKDDLHITGMTYLDYDDASLKIVGDDLDSVVIEDPMYRVVGKGLVLTLRPKDDGLPLTGTTTGFNGAQSILFKRDPHVMIRDVGGTGGGLAGNSPSSAPAQPRLGEKTPLDVRSDGIMLIQLPKPKTQPAIGPPAPDEPTYAWFNRNVEVVRGKVGPGLPVDTLNSDKLFLTFLPKKPVPKVAGAPAPTAGAEKEAGGGSLGNLDLKRAHATGPNVWLVSSGQGMKARCLELIHEKHVPEAPDKTYLLGSASSPLIVEKTEVAQEGPTKGQVSSFTKIRTIDATIFDSGEPGEDHMAIVARGPGDLETRPGLNKPVQRKAKWLDKLTWQSEFVVGKNGAPPTPTGKRILILTGDPRFTDLDSQSQLDARDHITVYLKPKPAPAKTAANANAVASKAAGAEKPKDAAAGSSSFEIERLYARTDVRLNSPNKTLVARDWLNAEFEPAPADPNAKPKPPAPKVTAVAASAPVPAPANSTHPKATTTAAAGAKPEPAKPAEALSKATADRVYAKIFMRPGESPAIQTRDAAPAPGAGARPGEPARPPGASNVNGETQRAELDSAMLRGAVVYHQDPSPGKARGTDVVGEAVDIKSQGEDRQRFIVYNHDPKKPPDAKARDLTPLARVDTEDLTFRGETLVIDQAADTAEINDRGSITMLAASGLLSDKGLTAPPPGPNANANVNAKPPGAKAKPEPAPAKQTPMYIEFTRGMKFFGRPTDRPPLLVARAEFMGTVHGETDESTFDCSKIMTVYFDRNIKLVRPKADPNAKPAQTAQPQPQPEEPKPQVAIIDMVRDVIVFNEKVDPQTKETLQRQRIEGDRLVYYKTSGDFYMPKQSGIVYLYEREGEKTSLTPGAGGTASGKPVVRGAMLPSGDRKIIRTAGPGAKPEAVIGRNTGRTLVDSAPKLKDKKTLPALVLTQIRFSRQMNGRFGTGKESDKYEPRRADFFGDVEVMHGPVADADTVFDYDKRPATAEFITSQILRVVSEPSRTDPDAPPRYLMTAWENANAIVEDKIIQADRLTYDSGTNLFYAYGEEGRDILIAQQGQVGQPASIVPGQAMWYNAKTGQSQLLDPRSIAFVDSRTGQRPRMVPPDSTVVKPRNPARTRFRNLRGSTERQGFGSGGR